MQRLHGGLASRASEWKALAQTENKVCPVSGEGKRGQLVRVDIW